MPKDTILEFDDFRRIIPQFSTPLGRQLLKILMAVVGVERVNALYAHSAHLSGIAFLDSIFDELQLSFRVNNREILRQMGDTPFITVSNHPYGGLDGILLIRILAETAPHFKVLVNWILMYIEALAPYFIAVNPTASHSNQISLQGLRQAIRHLHDGYPLGLFPAGAVSKIQGFKIKDRAWQPNIVRLIKQAEVPVVPICFNGHNSLAYNLLGVVSWRLRTLRLPSELFNKQGEVITVSIGSPIPVETIQSFRSSELLATFLCDQTYKTGQNSRT